LTPTYRPLGEGKKGLDGVKIWPFFLLPIGLLGEVTDFSVMELAVLLQYFSIQLF
jgi:hypothetical protein